MPGRHFLPSSFHDNVPGPVAVLDEISAEPTAYLFARYANLIKHAFVAKQKGIVFGVQGIVFRYGDPHRLRGGEALVTQRSLRKHTDQIHRNCERGEAIH
jgi:hypothetical protein